MNEVIVILNKIRSLYNVGAIFRTAEALGISKLILTGYTGITNVNNEIELHPKLSKTALKGIDVQWEHSNDPLATIATLKKLGYEIISLEQTPQSTLYTKHKFKPKTALIVGHELDGVENPLIKESDHCLEIPMQGKGISLNVSIATSIVLYEMNRQIS